MARTVDIPFGYGDVIAITGSGPKVVVWFKDTNSVVRGLLMDLSDPTNPVLNRDEIIIRRKTEGQVRQKKGKLPPVGNPVP
jgi:hypothetical protein